MVVNLAERYTNLEGQEDDVRVNIIRDVDVKVIGYGFKLNMDITSLDNLMFPGFLLIYFLKGKGQLKHGNRRMDLEPGSIYLLTPFELYDGLRTSAEAMDYMYIYFDLQPISKRSIFRRCACQFGDDFYRQPWTRRVLPLLEEVRRLDTDNSYQQAFLLQCTVHNVLVNILLGLTSDLIHELLSHGEDDNLVDQAFAYVEQHLQEPLHIGRMGREIGTSRSSLNRVFAEVLQIPPAKALTRFKMHKAIKLMRKGASVKQTAKAVGYSSSFHFSRIFKTVMGKSPTDYLKF